MEFWSSTPTLARIFWIVAATASVVFVVQAIITFSGISGHEDMQTDDASAMDDNGAFQVFTLRNFITFLLGFGWAGVLFGGRIENSTSLIVIAFSSGIIFVATYFVVLIQISRLAKDQTFRIEETIGKNATVYLTIPPGGKAHGKIQVAVSGVTHELNAITGAEARPTGTQVTVVKVQGENLVYVE
jgi:membrane protein implicated in regulation of membrane protease activity